MAKKLEPINLAALYCTENGGGCILDETAFRRFTRRLRYRGFKLSPCKEAYFHPTHWISGADIGFKSPGDTWLFNDAFMARTPEARAHLEEDE